MTGLGFHEYPADELTYLPRADVIRCCEGLDLVALAEDTLLRHATGRSILVDEAYLPWMTSTGQAARSLAMPGGLHHSDGLRLGLKVINGSLGNPARGIARSQGLLMLFDPETARPRVLMESAYISSMRTAAVTAVAAQHLGHGLRELAVLGCGTLAMAHLIVLHRALPELASVRLFDVDPDRAEAMAEAVRTDPVAGRLDVIVAAGPEECVTGADLVVPVTTVTEGYIRHEWLAPGSVLSHVSLDDVLPEVVDRSDLVVVDDWNLVSTDRNRLLGRLWAAGRLRAPDGGHIAGAEPDPAARQVDTTIGDVVAGAHPGRAGDKDIVLVNPFGMAILDVALGSAVAEVAVKEDVGRRIPL